jgi:predicted dehydrogenase
MDNHINNCLIVGAGQLGSRHLQGLVKYSGQLEIYVLDPSIDSLKIAQEREKEITHKHKIIYTQSWEILPDFFDIVIVATNANIRESVINKLLENHKVRFLILEKVLFQELDAYQRVQDLFVRRNVITYVNHPRRIFESYINIKANLNSNNQSIYSVVGGKWGLGCNALHFLDLFVFLSGKKLQDINVSLIEDELLESSRKGFVEFTGTLTGHLTDGSFFSITSLKGESSAISVTIFNNEQRFIIQEGGTPQIYELEKKNLFSCKNDVFKVQYQSELTSNITVGLLNNDFCSLPRYDEVRHTHELFLTTMLEKYNKITGLQATILPIT